MPRTAKTVTHHRTLWVSDVHLGSPGCKAKLLTDFLRRNDCEQLYLVGDIFDGWKMKSKFFWTPDHSRVIKAVISKARRGTKVYYLTGNHDGFMRQFVSTQLRLGKIRVANEVVHTTADGRKLLILHGDAFDDVINGLPWLAYMGDVGYEALMKSSDLLNRAGARLGLPYWSLSAFTKNGVKSVVQFLSGVDDKIVERCKRDKYDGVVTGHTHHAEIRLLKPGITSLNCGDWVESCSALSEDFNGHISILSGLPATNAAPVPKAKEAAPVWLPRSLMARLPRITERISKRKGPLRRSAHRTDKAMADTSGKS